MKLSSQIKLSFPTYKDLSMLFCGISRKCQRQYRDDNSIPEFIEKRRHFPCPKYTRRLIIIYCPSNNVMITIKNNKPRNKYLQ